MAAPSHPQHKRRLVDDARQHRAASTPPQQHKLRQHCSLQMDQSKYDVTSRHSSPGRNSSCARVKLEELVPRRLTSSPAPVPKLKDRTRKRLAQYTTIDHAVGLLKSSKNIIVLTGAGVSTSLGIPAFRGDDGFYSRLPASMGTPEDFFSIANFKHNNEEFWKYVRPLLPKHYRNKIDNTFYAMDKCAAGCKDFSTVPTPRFSKTHAFLALLQHKQKLLTNYTQNIDGLEFAAGVKDEKVFRCHGSWDRATCLSCGSTTSAKNYLPVVHKGERPIHGCSVDTLTQSSGAKGRGSKSAKKAKKRKRREYEGDSDHSSDNGIPTTPPGLYKPNITFFNESLSTEYDQRLQEDSRKVDLFLIIGTSLKVRPVKTMLVDLPSNAPQIWINKERFNGSWSDMPGVQVDIELLGECDMVVQELCSRAGWVSDLENFTWRPRLDRTQVEHGRDTDHKRESRPEMRESSAAKVGKYSASGCDDKVIAKRDPAGPSKPSNLPVIIVQDQSVHSPKQEPEITIQITDDIDAPWRWRFTKRVSRSPSPIPNSVYTKKQLKNSTVTTKHPASSSSHLLSQPIAIRDEPPSSDDKDPTHSSVV